MCCLVRPEGMSLKKIVILSQVHTLQNAHLQDCGECVLPSWYIQLLEKFVEGDRKNLLLYLYKHCVPVAMVFTVSLQKKQKQKNDCMVVLTTESWLQETVVMRSLF